MVSKCNICGELNCTWVLPDDYAPSINIRNYKKNDVLTVFSNCMALIKNQIFDVKEGKLVGYSRLNLSQSLKYGFQKMFHKQASVERNQAVVLKIKETLNYILQINSGRPETVMGYPLITEDYKGELNNLTFYPGGCIFYTYEDLAKKNS